MLAPSTVIAWECDGLLRCPDCGPVACRRRAVVYPDTSGDDQGRRCEGCARVLLGLEFHEGPPECHGPMEVCVDDPGHGALFECRTCGAVSEVEDDGAFSAPSGGLRDE